MAHPSDRDASVERIDAECFLLRQALSLEEQANLCEYIHSRDKTPANQPRAMMPAPKTLLLGDDDHPNIQYGPGDASLVNDMVDRSAAVLKSEGLSVMGGFDMCGYTALSMATIRYEAPTGRFPPHVDHCQDSLVCLASLGRTANFMVKGSSNEVSRFKLYSGDVLVFNASSAANVLHGVESIDESASETGEALAGKFPTLQGHRYGVQCRMYFS
ncbi:hypothetical protein CYMTET_38065 [Cymbomonas tetramitiformis]|uniref:Alpha-ketoglutarate-dependent dioxygenase AlkB-like domain-containing protein n=1 Tax=Cymbomonas tetramitiformis TaxID=36881 RepID=A0AAE0CEH8_9CHLO|nr:hypothetical protein CYMTET_38065 [Cymbomonas tetramitiformis]|eukprot:gene10412-12313_t